MKKITIALLLITLLSPLCFAQTQSATDKKVKAATANLKKMKGASLFVNTNKNLGQWYFQTPEKIKAHIDKNKTEVPFESVPDTHVNFIKGADILLIGEHHANRLPKLMALSSVNTYNNAAAQNKWAKVTDLFVELTQDWDAVLNPLVTNAKTYKSIAQQQAACMQLADKTLNFPEQMDRYMAGYLCSLKIAGTNIHFVELAAEKAKKQDPACCANHNLCITGTDTSPVCAEGIDLRNSAFTLEIQKSMAANSKAVFIGGIDHLASMKSMMTALTPAKKITSLMIYGKTTFSPLGPCPQCKEDAKTYFGTNFCKKLSQVYINLNKNYLLPVIPKGEESKAIYKNPPADWMLFYL